MGLFSSHLHHLPNLNFSIFVLWSTVLLLLPNGYPVYLWKQLYLIWLEIIEYNIQFILHKMYLKSALGSIQSRQLYFMFLWNMGSIMLQWIITEKRTKYDWSSSSNKYGLICQNQQGAKLQSTHKEKNGTRSFVQRSFYQCQNTTFTISVYFYSGKTTKHSLDTNHSLVILRS